MTSSPLNEAEATPDNPQQLIARLERENQRLLRQLGDERFTLELREALILATTTGTIAAPVSHTRLLEMIVETAGAVISAHAGALFLVDEASGELRFEVAIGQKSAEVKHFRIPLGHGIAGLVAVSGQPIAIADAQNDPRQADDISQTIGYAPQTILCVPLFYNDRVNGVLELLDKQGGGGFTPHDMDVLGLFANQAAVAIEQSETHRHLAGLIVEVLRSLGSSLEDRAERLVAPAHAFAAHTETEAHYYQAATLAQLVQEIVWAGENETTACQALLQGFVDYLRSRPSLSVARDPAR